MNSKDLERLTNGLRLLESKEEKEHLINNFSRLKNDVPFSKRLNDWLENWFKHNNTSIKFTKVDDFDSNDLEGTLRMHIQRFKETGKIHVWTGESDNSIFGVNRLNWYFRAWHDYIHVINNLGYDFLGESIVSSIQASQLPSEWHFERELINIEVVGQAQYFSKVGKFIADQRRFTINYLTDPNYALNACYETV